MTIEAEFKAESEVTQKLLGVREILCEIGMVPTLPMLIHADNQAAIRQLEVEASSLKAKHIDIRVKLVCDLSRRVIVMAKHLLSEDMLANLLTKALDAHKLANCVL